VYDPKLWMWFSDSATIRPVGLGIAEADYTIGELSLEWIRVLPAARWRGVARALVREMLTRASSDVRTATVSGVHGSPAEIVYRACGLRGENVWWCLQTR